MRNKKDQPIYIALLRGINVGGHHKVPMADLRNVFEEIGFSDIKTLLNSGNVIFKGKSEQPEALEENIALHLVKTFGFPIPVMIRMLKEIQEIIAYLPFKNVNVNKDTRLYVSFLKETPVEIPALPYESFEGAFKIISMKGKAVFSVLDVSKSKTTDSMKVLERLFSKEITTRNWNTVEKIGSNMNKIDTTSDFPSSKKAG